ncbi:hypothetical protein [Sulfolobus acidocaldarius]|uniref:Uncharacterized protein n=2 Tax=Sulfolobus acidocaldarius TaxID=2285 RepID=M1J0Q6_9CREN|nr:hypothetical protein [Sulfolobus acidocaldarius]AGE71925.1 hypothetical protein SacN8_09840 [Sulfolobus acidocaldarius N8]AGE74197.1 hypothetical protein SacRon12I_09860 [Sulfolobus acidocaldarius Ron12/I]
MRSSVQSSTQTEPLTQGSQSSATPNLVPTLYLITAVVIVVVVIIAIVLLRRR